MSRSAPHVAFEQTTIASFEINPDLTVTCFTRLNRLSAPKNGGPLFVVREFDSRVIRARHDTAGLLSEQAKRAGVRSVILHMNLKLEHGTKEEIQVLKQIGVLGRRAPSCSLLCGSDMALMLEAFGRKQTANELRIALETTEAIKPFDPTKVVRDDEMEAQEQRMFALYGPNYTGPIPSLGATTGAPSVNFNNPSSSASSTAPTVVDTPKYAKKPKANPLTGKAGRARLQQLLQKGTIDSGDEEEEYIKQYVHQDNEGGATAAEQANAAAAVAAANAASSATSSSNPQWRYSTSSAGNIGGKREFGAMSGAPRFNYQHGSYTSGHYQAANGYTANITQLPPFADPTPSESGKPYDIQLLDAGGVVGAIQLGHGFDERLLLPLTSA